MQCVSNWRGEFGVDAQEPWWLDGALEQLAAGASGQKKQQSSRQAAERVAARRAEEQQREEAMGVVVETAIWRMVSSSWLAVESLADAPGGNNELVAELLQQRQPGLQVGLLLWLLGLLVGGLAASMTVCLWLMRRRRQPPQQHF